MKKKLTIAAAVALFAVIFFFFGGLGADYKFTVLKTPPGIVMTGDSAGYVGWVHYKVKVSVTNNSGKTLNFMRVLAIIKTSDGRKIGFAMKDTGPVFKNGTKMQLNLDTNIPKELGNPEIIELYSELNN
ncbi:MAG: hypothetical protein ACTHNW_06035 [Mucilaginibacter sp.]